MVSIPGLYSCLIKLYIDGLTNGTTSPSGVWLLITIIVSCFLAVIVRTTAYLRCQIFGLLMRKTLTSILYSKLLKLPVSGVASATPGRLISLGSGDMAVIEQGSLDVHSLLSAPFAATVLLLALFQIVSVSKPRLAGLLSTASY